MSVRNKKTNKSQMEVIVNFLEQNRVLVTGKTHPLNPGELDDKWEELTVLLNSVENGARKEKKQWKTVSIQFIARFHIAMYLLSHQIYLSSVLI